MKMGFHGQQKNLLRIMSHFYGFQIILKNGTVLYRRISSSTELDNNTERLAVDQTFPAQILPTDIIRISFVSLCRLSNDSLVIEHINDSDGIAKSSATFRGVREA